MIRTFFLSASSGAAMAAVLLAGCAAGPDFAPPAAPDVSAYGVDISVEATADGEQTFRPGADIPSQWWSLFHCAKLDALIDQALKENPDLEAAEAALRAAEDNLGAGGAALFPQMAGNLSSERSRVSKVANNGVSSIYTMHTASVGVSYALDLWGGTRRSVERLEALAESARFQKEAAYLALTSNVVGLALAEAGLREQISATEEIAVAQKKVLEILTLRFKAGAVPQSAVLSQKTTLAATEANLPALRHQLAVARHALSALIGKTPSSGPGAEFRLADVTLPKEIPLSLPAAMVEQRPDVRAAREELHAASAAIGIAVAARLPNIVVSADMGSMAMELGKMFAPGGGFWSFGGSASETLFDMGGLANKEQAARDAFDVASAQYRKTVLNAFQNVADALHAVQSDAERLKAQREANQAASENYALAKAQLDAGAIAMADLLLAQQALLQSKATQAQLQAQRYADTAALFAALGGGWWNRKADELNATPAKSGKESL